MSTFRRLEQGPKLPTLGVGIGVGWAMRRREFIRLVIGSGSAWPLSLNAQQSKRWRIGFLHPGQSALVSNRIVAFREGLGASGPMEATDAEIIARLANEQMDKLPAMAMELVQQNVQAICAVSPPARSCRAGGHQIHPNRSDGPGIGPGRGRLGCQPCPSGGQRNGHL